MFNKSKNISIFQEYNNILLKKINISNNIEDITKNKTENVKNVGQQLELLSVISSSDENNLSYLIKDINKYFSDINIDYLAAKEKISPTKERILIDSLKSELIQIIDICKNIKNLLNNQLLFLKAQKYEEYIIELKKEKNLVLNLEKLLNENKILEETYLKNLKEVKRLLQSDLVSKIFHKIVGFRARLSNHILKPLGTENIPLIGPVIFAPRHYGISGDITLLMDGIPRRVFTVQAAEWVRSDFFAGLYKNIFEKSGFIPTIRPESQAQYDNGTSKDKYIFSEAAPNLTLKKMVNILSLNQALIIFPEGHPNITPAFTYKDKDSGIIPLKPGLAICLEMAENVLNKKIPVIPVGIIVDDKNKTLQARFGKPMFYVPRKNLNPRESLTENKSLRDTFNEALRVEIAKLSEVGLSDIPEYKLFKKKERNKLVS